MKAALALLAITGAGLACTPERPSEKGGGGISVGDGDGGGDGQEGQDGGGSDDLKGESEEGQPSLDFSGVEEIPIGCKEVAFWFVIDNSGSMAPYQAALAEIFPEFIQTIHEKLTQEGVYFEKYKVAVLKTDDLWNRDCDQIFCKEGVDDDACMMGEVDICEGTHNLCHDELGAFVTWPRDRGEACFDLDNKGPRYITSQIPLEEQTGIFTCLQPGDKGNSTERHLSTLEAAINLSVPGKCNEGGMPVNGPMVLVMITDEDDKNWMNKDAEMAGLAQKLMDKVGGKEDVVALGILPRLGECEMNYDIKNGSAPVLYSFFQQFDSEKVFIGDVCSDSYEDLFESAVDVIVDTCVEYRPAE